MPRKKKLPDNEMTVKLVCPTVPDRVTFRVPGDNDAGYRVAIQHLTTAQKDALAVAWRRGLDKRAMQQTEVTKGSDDGKETKTETSAQAKTGILTNALHEFAVKTPI